MSDSVLGMTSANDEAITRLGANMTVSANFVADIVSHVRHLEADAAGSLDMAIFSDQKARIAELEALQPQEGIFLQVIDGRYVANVFTAGDGEYLKACAKELIRSTPPIT